jgi:hypothetical protein
MNGMPQDLYGELEVSVAPVTANEPREDCVKWAVPELPHLYGPRDREAIIVGMLPAGATRSGRHLFCDAKSSRLRYSWLFLSRIG